MASICSVSWLRKADRAGHWRLRRYCEAAIRRGEEPAAARARGRSHHHGARVERIRGQERGGGAMAKLLRDLCRPLLVRATARLEPTGESVLGRADCRPKRKDLPILRRIEMKERWDKVQKIPNEVERWALVFCLLSGLRRGSLESLAWENLCKPVLQARCIRIPAP